MSESIAKILTNNINLPSIPAVIHQLNQLVSRDDVGSHEVAKVVETDPAFTARILKLINSPFYGLSRQVTSVEDSIALLGMEAIHQLLTATTVMSSLRSGSRVLNMQQFWIHSFGVGALARHLLKEEAENIRQEAFLCGVLHDIGRLVLVRADTDKYEAFFDRGKSVTDLEKEEKWFGMNHQEVGSVLAKQWNFPENIINVVSFHHTPEQSPGNAKLVSAVNIADVICNALMVGHGGSSYVSSFSVEAWHELNIDISQLKQRIIGSLKEVEHTKAILNDIQ